MESCGTSETESPGRCASMFEAQVRARGGRERHRFPRLGCRQRARQSAVHRRRRPGFTAGRTKPAVRFARRSRTVAGSTPQRASSAIARALRFRSAECHTLVRAGHTARPCRSSSWGGGAKSLKGGVCAAGPGREISQHQGRQAAARYAPCCARFRVRGYYGELPMTGHPLAKDKERTNK